MSFLRPRAVRFLKASVLARPTLNTMSYRTTAIQRQKITQDEVSVYGYPPTGQAYGSSNYDSTGPVETVLSVDRDERSFSGPGVSVTTKVSYGPDQNAITTMPPILKKFTLQDQVCVVTGGARGLGYNIAQALAEVGARAIALVDIKHELGDAAADELHEKYQVPVVFYDIDVRDEMGIKKLVDDVAMKWGSVDVLVNSAGIADSNIKAEDYNEAMFRRLIDINVTGSFLMAQACGRHMIKAETGGSMVFIASMSGSVVNFPQEQCCYNASKAAVIQLGKSLAAEWAPHKIRVNCISPGYMDTELNRVPALDGQKKIWTSRTPQGRLGDIDELNGLAVYLASGASSFVTGANFVIDGGYSVY